jgi:hypothetical protein
MRYLFVPLLLAALGLPLSVIAARLCNPQNQPVRAMGWVEGWAFPPSISYDKYSVLTFAFALVSFHFSIPSLLI